MSGFDAAAQLCQGIWTHGAVAFRAAAVQTEAVLSPAEVAACEQRLDVLSLLRGLGLASLPPCDEGSSEEEEEGGRNDEGGGGGGGRDERFHAARQPVGVAVSAPPDARPARQRRQRPQGGGSAEREGGKEGKAERVSVRETKSSREER